MSIEKAVHLNRLFDLYSSLLTPRQKEVFQYYYHEDLSFQEIADLLSISRAAAHDNISKTSKVLQEYEEKLGIERLLSQLESLADERVQTLISRYISGGNYE